MFVSLKHFFTLETISAVIFYKFAGHFFKKNFWFDFCIAINPLNKTVIFTCFGGFRVALPYLIGFPRTTQLGHCRCGNFYCLYLAFWSWKLLKITADVSCAFYQINQDEKRKKVQKAKQKKFTCFFFYLFNRTDTTKAKMFIFINHNRRHLGKFVFKLIIVLYSLTVATFLIIGKNEDKKEKVRRNVYFHTLKYVAQTFSLFHIELF